jgi:hypothetical protein
LLFLGSLDFFVSFLGQAKNEKPVRLEDEVMQIDIISTTINHIGTIKSVLINLTRVLFIVLYVLKGHFPVPFVIVLIKLGRFLISP